MVVNGQGGVESLVRRRLMQGNCRVYSRRHERFSELIICSSRDLGGGGWSWAVFAAASFVVGEVCDFLVIQHALAPCHLIEDVGDKFDHLYLLIVPLFIASSFLRPRPSASTLSGGRCVR